MYCVIQQVMRKKPDLLGEYREIEAYPLEMSINGEAQIPLWRWEWSGGRFERSHLEAYKITIHHSYREGGKVKKRQYAVCTMSYYDVCESWWGDCIVGSEKALADKLGIEAAELCGLIDTKLDPLRERLEAEFHQSPEYIAKQEHRRILEAHSAARSEFSKKYDVDGDEYDRCYDVFGTLRNKEYLEQIKAQHRARRRYQESRRSTYEQYASGSYSVQSASTYSEDERAILKKFYRSLSKLYHPDLNPDKDTTAEMKLLNKLKEHWGV